MSVLSPFSGQILSGASVSNHETLSNILQATSGVTNGHISDSTQTIAGIKTFSSIINTNAITQKSSTVTISTALDNTHNKVYCNNSGSITITLPNATTYPDIIYSITNINTGSTIINTVSSQTINGSTSRTMTGIYGTMTLQAVGTQWIILSTNAYGGI